MSRLLPVLLLLAGCVRDPVWFGWWEITEARRDGVKQRDMGPLEIMRNGELATILRYRWTGDAFEPDPSPTTLRGGHDVAEQDDVFEAFREEGEEYTLFLSPFCTDPTRPLEVVDYGPNRAVLRSKQAPWPGRPAEELLPVELHLER